MAINGILGAEAIRMNLPSPIRAGGGEKAISPTSESSSLSAQRSDSYTLSSNSSDAVSPAASVQLATTFTQEIGGEKLASRGSESNGEYVATAPTPPGASAHGSTIEVAEYNLKVKLDAII